MPKPSAPWSLLQPAVTFATATPPPLPFADESRAQVFLGGGAPRRSWARLTPSPRLLPLERAGSLRRMPATPAWVVGDRSAATDVRAPWVVAGRFLPLMTVVATVNEHFSTRNRNAVHFLDWKSPVANNGRLYRYPVFIIGIPSVPGVQLNCSNFRINAFGNDATSLLAASG